VPCIACTVAIVEDEDKQLPRVLDRIAHYVAMFGRARHYRRRIMVHGREGRNQLRRPAVKELEVARSQRQNRRSVSGARRSVEAPNRTVMGD
jgi:hypothetical protein